MLSAMRASGAARALLAVVGVVVAVGGAMWWLRPAGNPPAPVSSLHGANLLLVTIDTLRADRLGAYGSRAGLTPTLDALAARGVRFTRTWSHVPITLPAHTSILTGLLPPHHGVRNNGAFRLGEGPATLAEILHGAGYRTGAFVGAFVLDARFGLTRGFDEYDDRYGTAGTSASFHFVERPADRVLEAATAWISQATGEARPWSSRAAALPTMGKSPGRMRHWAKRSTNSGIEDSWRAP
jgi:arylsulfatase A-like enzyme